MSCAQPYMRDLPSHSPQSTVLQRITSKTFSLHKPQVKGLTITGFVFLAAEPLSMETTKSN